MPMTSLMPLANTASTVAGAAYVTTQLLLTAYASHRWLLLARWWRCRVRAGVEPSVPREWPTVTVQLPIFDEPAVAERLIDAACALRYPTGRLEIQVLDDSDDGTTARAGRAVARHHARGVDITLLHRERRVGYKAGALAAGLASARGELVAVFDADFVPPPEFLERVVPHFGRADVGMVQARWTHLNRDRSWMTAAQAVMLDSHFLIEHAARMGTGLFFNFNGSAGVWRRACIEAAGGWTDDTLTEDLDLSYRAQLVGWRFVLAPDVVAPAELPADVRALKSQQRRWVKGSIQTARKLLPSLLSAPLPRRVQLEAVFHLTGNAAYPLLLALALLLFPVLVWTATLSPVLALLMQAATLLFGVLPVALFMALGQRRAGAGAARAVFGVLGALTLGAGLAVNNSIAVWEGLGGGVGEWERTPKTGDGGAGRAPGAACTAAARFGALELSLALWFAGVAAVAAARSQYRVLPFLALLVAGLGAIGGATLRSRRRARATSPRAEGAARQSPGTARRLRATGA